MSHSRVLIRVVTLARIAWHSYCKAKRSNSVDTLRFKERSERYLTEARQLKQRAH